MSTKTSVITGANTGIGKAIAIGLARAGCRVFMVCRDPERGRQAQLEIGQKSNNTDINLVVGDLSRMEQIHSAARHILEQAPRIDILVHNAGIWPTSLERTPLGLELSFVVNHLAPYMLNHLLLDRLKDGAPSRIVQVSARLYPFGRIDLKRTPKGDDFSGFRTYANTKLCNLLCTRELARRLKGTGVTVNSVHPGVVRTSLGGAQGGIQGWLFRRSKLFMRSPASGAAPALHMALSSELEGVTDAFFNRFKRVNYHKAACDEVLCRQLWDLSEKLAGLKSEN